MREGTGIVKETVQTKITTTVKRSAAETELSRRISRCTHSAVQAMLRCEQ